MKPKNDEAFLLWLDESVHTLLEYKKLLRYWEKIYDPRSPIDKVNDRYLESINKRGYTEYYLDKLLYGNESEQKNKYFIDITKNNPIDNSNDKIIRDANLFADEFKHVREKLDNSLLTDLKYFKDREFYSQSSFTDVKCLKTSDHSIYFPISKKPSESEVLALFMILLSKDQNNNFCFPTIENIGIEKIIDISSNGIDLMVQLTDWFKNDNECNIRNAVFDINNGKKYFDPQKISTHFKTSEIEFNNSRSFAEIKTVCRVVNKGKLKVENEPHSMSMCSHLICWSVGNYRIDRIKTIDALDGEYIRDEARANEEKDGIYFFKKKSNAENPHKLVLVILSELDVFDN